MKLKRLLLIAVLSVVVFSLDAQTKNCLLWKISGNGLNQPSYLFGTHHLIPLSFLKDVKGLDEVLKNTQQVVGEVNMSDKEAIQKKMSQNSILPAYFSYQKSLSADDYKFLSHFVKKNLGADFGQLERVKPAALSMLISIILYKKIYPELGNDMSFDEYFQEEAKKQSKPIKGLETVDEQITALLNVRPLDKQLEGLMCLIKNPDYLKKQMDVFNTSYKKYDLESLRLQFENESPDNPCPTAQNEKDILMKYRNEKWINVIPDIIKEKSSFIAVGCGHLVGETGLLNSLSKAGYTVEPVE